MSDTQDMIAESARRLFGSRVDRALLNDAEHGRWPASLWDEVAQAGFAEVLVPESAGGVSGRWTDAYPLFHAIGYYRLPLPLAETMIAAGLLARCGLQLPQGPLTVVHRAQGAGLRFVQEQGRLRIDGSVDSVPWARDAKAIVVAGECNGQDLLAVMEAGCSGMRIEPGTTVSREPRDRITFSGSVASAFVQGITSLPEDPVLLCGALARAIMIVGAAESILHQTVQYANDRVQFGRSIGKFQAIQQSLAVLAGEVASAKTATLAAVEAAEDVPSRFRVAVAKIRAGQASGACAAIAHQVHGAIGITDEHTLHYATRRLWTWRAEFGADRVWAQELGRQAIQRGGARFWSDLTARHSEERA